MGTNLKDLADFVAVWFQHSPQRAVAGVWNSADKDSSLSVSRLRINHFDLEEFNVERLQPLM